MLHITFYTKSGPDEPYGGQDVCMCPVYGSEWVRELRK